jgi:putative transposase
VLAALGQTLPRVRSLLVEPTTLLRWHRELVRRRWTYPRGPPGRPPMVSQARQLVLRLAAENPGWGYKRIHGELIGLCYTLSPSTVWNILRRHGIEPLPGRTRLTWRQFLLQQAAGIGTWATQQARKLLKTLAAEGKHPQILIRDREVKLTKAFDTFLRSEGVTVIRRVEPNSCGCSRRKLGRRLLTGTPCTRVVGRPPSQFHRHQRRGGGGWG